MATFKTYKELKGQFMSDFYEADKKSVNFADPIEFNTSASRTMKRFDYWRSKTADGRRAGHRDRMYHPGDWAKEFASYDPADFIWMPNAEAWERMYQSFLMYDRNQVAVAV